MSEEQAVYECVDPAALVRRLRDNVSRELAGLNEDEPRLALRYAEDLLGNELQMIRIALSKEGGAS